MLQDMDVYLGTLDCLCGHFFILILNYYWHIITCEQNSFLFVPPADTVLFVSF